MSFEEPRNYKDFFNELFEGDLEEIRELSNYSLNFLDYDEFAIRKLEDYFGSIYDEELDRMIVELVTGHEYEQNPKEVYDKHSESISKAREFLYNLADVADSENGELCSDKGKFLRGIADIQEDSVFVRVLSKNIDELGVH